MKKISKIGGAILAFLFCICNVCSADVVDPGRNRVAKNVANDVAEKSGGNILTYTIVGALVGVVVVCAIMVIVNIVNKKKEK